jgi:catechol 2,3-dioxygenase-like lactoylglutathione lyase family enzyme
MKTKFRGVFLTSENPAATADFYRDVAGLALEKVGAGEHVYWKADNEGVQLAIHDAAKFADYTQPARPDSNLTHLYFKIDDQGGFLEHLEKLGLTPYATDEVVMTVIDPDGRKVLFGVA